MAFLWLINGGDPNLRSGSKWDDPPSTLTENQRDAHQKSPYLLSWEMIPFFQGPSFFGCLAVSFWEYNPKS